MRSDYLDSLDSGQDKHGNLGIVAALYGWATVDMLSKFRNTARFTIPGTGFLDGGKGIGKDMVGSMGIARKAAGITDPVGDLLYGKSFRAGGNFWGKATLGTSSIASGYLGWLNISDPIYFAATNLTKPAMWPLGIAWFGGMAIMNNAAKAMRKTQYVSMGSAFIDNGAIYTSRQRAVRAIAESHLQARSAIGNEAQLFHHSGG